jgi:hypothetical protein
MRTAIQVDTRGLDGSREQGCEPQEETHMGTSQGIVQTGWHVRTSDGRELGTVVDFSGDSIVVSGGAGRRHTIPKSYLDEEEEGSKLAILSIDSAEVGDLGSG